MAKPLQYCKVISLQLIKISGKKIRKESLEYLHHPESAFTNSDPAGLGGVQSSGFLRNISAQPTPVFLPENSMDGGAW